MKRVESRSVLVTGAASGIGRAAARMLAEHGASVLCADLNEAGAHETAQLIHSASGLASACRLDVTSEADWIAGMEQAVKSHSRLDILVHSAGIATACPVADLSLEEWRRTMAVNLDGAFLGTKHAIRTMRETGGGSIVLVSSATGLRTAPGASAYATSKAAVCMFARTAAKECAEAGLKIRVNTVCPGGVKTPIWSSMPFFQELVKQTGSEEGAFKAMVGDRPGRFIEPEEVALAILYLASDESLMVTGTDLVIDEGYSI